MPSSFTAPLILEALAEEFKGRGMFLTYAAFSYDVGFLGSGDTITVPVGFKTDLASIPFFARPFIPLAGRMAKPALIHDYLLVQGEVERAQKVFAEALKVANVGALTRFVMVGSVRLHWGLKKLFGRA
jgi:hypothetical protein